MWRKYLSMVWVWRVIPIGLLVVLRLLKHFNAGYLGSLWWSDLLLVVGWIVGWLLADSDHLFYATMCNPQELTCQRVRGELEKRDWRNAWRILESTKFERTKLPIRNILTGLIMTGVGLWIISSGTSSLASGAVLGFSIHLFSEILFDQNFQKWYWLFARGFDANEHRSLLVMWGAVLVWLWSMLARG